MGELIKWWLFIEIIGWITFPICFNLLKNLFSKGYAFTKITALLIWGYIYWIGNTFGILSNTRSGSIFALYLLLLLSIISLLRKNCLKELIRWIRENYLIIIFFEFVFLLSIAFMTFMRGTNPDIIGTEKPMELMFINGILRSPGFPPNDPWLAGYSISYYYFGYLIAAAIIKLIGTDAGTAFNLMLVFWFGLISIGSAEIIINMVIGRVKETSGRVSSKHLRSSLVIGLLAPFLLLIVSNGEGFLELLHSRGVFWTQTQGGILKSRFWNWIDIQELTLPPPKPYDFNLQRPGGTWWWRASRVLQDYTVKGHSREIIDEFPFFSFFLGDLHPHVLAMPVVLLCINCALCLFLQDHNYELNGFKDFLTFWRNGFSWFLAFSLASLIFMNTWDFPIYFGLVSIVLFIKILSQNESLINSLKGTMLLLLSIAIVSIFLFLPFIIGFSSQAGGLLPSLIFQSRSIHVLVMFLPFAAILFFDLIFRILPDVSGNVFRRTFGIVLIGFVFLMLFSCLFPLISKIKPDFYTLIGDIFNKNIESKVLQQKIKNQSFLSIYEAESFGELISESFNRFISDPVHIVILISFITIGLSVLYKFVQYKKRNHFGSSSENLRLDSYYGLLIVVSSGLILFPELFYLRDQFGWRMNTIFKFYFQAWILFSICTAYSVSQLISHKNSVIKYGSSVIFLISFIPGLVFPINAIREQFDVLEYRDLNLNGNQYLLVSNSNELEAIQFLENASFGFIAEAVGSSYSNYGRISKFTGLPTVLGWPGHELQWRGGGEVIGSRESDINELYSTYDWYRAKAIIEEYNIKYIYIGDLERMTYQISEEKFMNNLPVIFTNSTVVIYEY